MIFFFWFAARGMWLLDIFMWFDTWICRNQVGWSVFSLWLVSLQLVAFMFSFLSHSIPLGLNCAIVPQDLNLSNSCTQDTLIFNTPYYSTNPAGTGGEDNSCFYANLLMPCVYCNSPAPWLHLMNDPTQDHRYRGLCTGWSQLITNLLINKRRSSKLLDLVSSSRNSNSTV